MTFNHDEQIGSGQPLVSIETKGRHPIDAVNSWTSRQHSVAARARSVICFIGVMTTSPVIRIQSDECIIAFKNRKW